MSRRTISLVVGALMLVLTTAGAAAHPDQHGPLDGHLVGTGAWGSMELVGKLRVTDVENTIADVAVSPDGNWAFVANWGRPTCAANSEKGGRKNPDAGA